MKAYELLFFVDPASTEEARAGAMKRIEVAITANGGTIDSVEDWGKRKLAYLINDEAEGYYVLFNYQAAPEFPAELDRVVKITDGVLRSLIVKKN